jgi:hypothetical protein
MLPASYPLKKRDGWGSLFRGGVNKRPRLCQPSHSPASSKELVRGIHDLSHTMPF